jgi:RNA polymerase sigma-70 factor (ECF subfamily)
MTTSQNETELQQDPELNNPEEAQWIKLARRGNSRAFSQLVGAYQRPIFNLCYRMLGDGAEAEDAAQEVFIRAYMKFDTYDDSRKFSSWLFSIGSHYCIDRLRKRRIQWISWDDLPPWRWLPDSDTPQPEEAFVDVETTEEIYELLNNLPPDYRAAVILKYWHEMPYEEIAETLDTTVSAIKSRLFRARKMMAGDASEQQKLQLGGVAMAES